MELRPGRRVVVHGLQKNPEKNGALGVLGQFIEEKGRWAVDFSSGSSNNFKPENLQVLQDNDDVDDDAEIPTAKIYITNLAGKTSRQDLIDLFKGLGVLERETTRGDSGRKDDLPYAVKIYKPGREGGDARVEYQDKAAAKAAIKTYNGYLLHGNTIGVAYAGAGRKFEPRELTLPWAMREENQQKLLADH